MVLDLALSLTKGRRNGISEGPGASLCLCRSSLNRVKVTSLTLLSD